MDGLVYENWKEEAFDIDEIKRIDGIKSAFGLDWGYTIDPTAFFCSLVDTKAMKLYVFDEMYERALTNKMIADRITAMGFGKETITGDSAEPKSITEVREHGLKNIRASRKGKDSVKNGIQRIQDYEIIVHPKCVNFLTEISQYCWEKDRFGQYTGRPEDANNHLMDAMRYGLEYINFPNVIGW